MKVQHFVSKKTLAQKLGVSVGLLTRLVYEEGMPHLKIGRSIRFDYDAVLAWFERRGALRKA
jgi:excisionase family DNA binding protein